jgi:DNA mismatch endonuclease, patch repair protein
MTDVHSREQRSFNMSRIRYRDTRPEMIVRSLVHRLGYRYRLHKRDLPGKPDLVLVRHKKIIDVYGCFFHMHKCKYGTVTPATNAEFWEQKRTSNRKRDQRNQMILKRDGWRVMIVWECETRDRKRLEKKLVGFLGESSSMTMNI